MTGQSVLSFEEYLLLINPTHEISKITEFFRKRNQEFKPNDNEITVIYTRNDFQLNPFTIN